MKRTLALIIVLLAASLTFAQTAVTFQVTDADSQAWSGGTYSVFLTSGLADPINAVPSLSGTMNATGGASFSLNANTWSFKACSAAVGSSSGAVGNVQVPCFVSTVAVSGSTQTVTLAPPAIRIPLTAPGLTVRAYADAEVVTPYLGSSYFNLITGMRKTWNGTAFIDEGDAVPQIFSLLPACSTTLEGIRRSVTDSNTVVWGATVAGSSTNHVLAYCDGTNWTVAAK